MTILQRHQQFSQLWKLVLPAVPLPPAATILGWLSGFSDEDIEQVLPKVARWLMTPRTDNADHGGTYRYVSRTLRNTREQRLSDTQINESTFNTETNA